jgi:hypothetical protein
MVSICVHTKKEGATENVRARAQERERERRKTRKREWERVCWRKGETYGAHTNTHKKEPHTHTDKKDPATHTSADLHACVCYTVP